MSSTQQMAIPPSRNSPRYIIRTAAALRSVSVGRRRPKHWRSARRRNTARAASTNTARVVTLNPPAVEPGEPPTSISSVISSREGSLSWERSRVLYPAVRGVTA